MWGGSRRLLLLLSVIASVVFSGTMATLSDPSQSVPASTEPTSTTEPPIPLPPSFCTEEGKFAFPDSCIDYRVCRALGTTFVIYDRQCPSGKIFDIEAQNCLPSSAVFSRPNCISDDISDPSVPIILPVGGDAEIDSHLNSDLHATDDQIETEASCQDIQAMISKVMNVSKTSYQNFGVIEIYVNKSNLGSPISILSLNDSDLEESVKNYNAALEDVQSKANVWINVVDIQDALRLTFHLLDKYLPVFQCKYEKHTRVRNKVKKIHERNIRDFRNKINNLSNEIKEMESTYGKFAIRRNATLRGRLSKKEKAVTQKELELGHNLKLPSVFKSLKSFLESVSSDAKTIENNATNSAGMLIAWFNDLLVSNTALKRATANVDRIITFLRADARSFKRSINKSKKELEEFNSEKKALRDLMLELDSKIDSNFQKLKDFQVAIDAKREAHGRQERRICDVDGEFAEQFKTSSENRSLICSHLMKIFSTPLSLQEEEVKLEQHRVTIFQNNKKLLTEIGQIVKRLGEIQEPIHVRETTIDNSQKKFHATNLEISNLDRYSIYQKEFLPTEKAAVSAIAMIISSLNEVACTFHNIHRGTDEKIIQAKAPERQSLMEMDIHHLIKSIVQHITKLQMQLDESRDKSVQLTPPCRL